MNKQNFRNKYVVIVHGHAASSQPHWFPWLKKTIESQGAVVTVACMPKSTTPDPVEWLQYLDNLSLPLDENTIFIGHNLGCVKVLNFLNKYYKEIDRIGEYIGFWIC